MAARARALPERVPPMPLTSESSTRMPAAARAARSRLTPYAAAGTPPAIGLPIVRMSGSRAWAAVYPPGPAQMVCVSSITSRVPVRRVIPRSAW